MTAKDKGILKMKKFEIIIPHRRLDDVSQILKGINVGGMSHYEIEGRGKVKAEPVAIGRGTAQYTPEFIPRVKVEVIVRDDQVEGLINELTGKLGGDVRGGKIFVADVQIAVDLSSKQRGESAI
ncbi:MAG: P-II family nitrogen regulator [Nitrososphaeraceae archaeon]